jgi:hypothetical protein
MSIASRFETQEDSGVKNAPSFHASIMTLNDSKGLPKVSENSPARVNQPVVRIKTKKTSIIIDQQKISLLPTNREIRSFAEKTESMDIKSYKNSVSTMDHIKQISKNNSYDRKSNLIINKA